MYICTNYEFFMSQPVRKRIKDTYGEEIGVKPVYTLLIDGNSLLKVAMRDEMISENGEHVGGIFQFLLQMKKLMTTRDWDYVYCFFDDKYSGILRYRLYRPYKANRDKNYENYGMDEETSEYYKRFLAKVDKMMKYHKKQKYEQDIKAGKKVKQEEQDDANFQRERLRILQYLEELFVRWIMDEKGTEADDLIAYYIKHKDPEEKCVIVSTDMDLTQLLSDSVYIYNPHLHKNVTSLNFQKEFGYPYQNVVTKKILCGDISDNISNISLLSENKLFEIMPEMKTRPVTVQEVVDRAKSLCEERLAEKKKPFKVCENIVNGVPNKEYDGDFYEINRKIIDLSEPLLTKSAEEELENMMHAPQDPEGRSFSNIYNLIREDGITELYNETKFSTFFSSFKPFIKREEERYENSQKVF